MPKPSPDNFLDVFAQVTESQRANLALDTSLTDVPGWDSLSMVMFLGTVDAEYGIQLDGGNVGRAKTVRDLYNLLDQEKA